MLSEEGFDYYKKYGELEAVEDIRDAVEAIEKRSNGLLHFVDAYRNLTRLPRPNFQIFEVSKLFKQIQLLMQPRVDEKKIAFKTELNPESIELTADQEMMEQALINLLINSIQQRAIPPQRCLQVSWEWIWANQPFQNEKKMRPFLLLSKKSFRSNKLAISQENTEKQRFNNQSQSTNALFPKKVVQESASQ